MMEDHASIQSHLSRGRRRTLEHIYKHHMKADKQLEKAEKHVLQPHRASEVKSRTVSVPQPEAHSLKKSYRERMMKYMWKDLKHRNTQNLTHLLSSDLINLDELDPNCTLLLYATKANMKAEVEVLLHNGSPFICDSRSDGLSPLHIAVKHGFAAVVAIMVRWGGVHIDTPTLYDNRTALHVAVKHRQMQILHLLLDNHADVNAPDIYGCTALHIAISTGRADTVRELLDQRADVNLCDKAGWSPLHTAVMAQGDILSTLESNKTAYPMTPSYIVRLLLSHGADICAQTRHGKTALHMAASRDNLEIVDVLLDHGSSPTVLDIHGRKADHYTLNYDIKTLLADSDLSDCDDPTKHIDMKIKSRSLIDLLDPQFLGNHFFSEGNLYDRDDCLINGGSGLLKASLVRFKSTPNISEMQNNNSIFRDTENNNESVTSGNQELGLSPTMGTLMKSVIKFKRGARRRYLLNTDIINSNGARCNSIDSLCSSDASYRDLHSFMSTIEEDTLEDVFDDAKVESRCGLNEGNVSFFGGGLNKTVVVHGDGGVKKGIVNSSGGGQNERILKSGVDLKKDIVTQNRIKTNQVIANFQENNNNISTVKEKLGRNNNRKDDLSSENNLKSDKIKFNGRDNMENNNIIKNRKAKPIAIQEDNITGEKTSMRRICVRNSRLSDDLSDDEWGSGSSVGDGDSDYDVVTLASDSSSVSGEEDVFTVIDMQEFYNLASV